LLYRIFPMLEGARPLEDGGALHVARHFQGDGRHDNPAEYGALYASRVPESAVAERLAIVRPWVVDDRHLRRPDGRRYAMATIDDSRLTFEVDLDDPRELVSRDLRPSRVATRDRTVTQATALAMFEEGRSGFLWWSTLEGSWANATVFAERGAGLLSLAEDPIPLSVDLPVVRRAAEAIGVRISGG
jgi:hypothetical protein